MNMNQQHEEIGRMFAERRALQRKLACLKNRLNRMEQKLSGASSSIANRHVAGHPIAVDADLPTCGDIMKLIEEETAALSRIVELDKYLSEV